MLTLGYAENHSRWIEKNPEWKKNKSCPSWVKVLPSISIKLVLQDLWQSACPRVYSFCEQFQCWALEVDLWRSYSSLTFRSTSGREFSIAFACIFLALKVRLVPVSFEDPEFKSSFSQSFSLYAKYQMAIHRDPPDECGKTEVLSLNVFSIVDEVVCEEA